jgi:hypothetical protein
MLWEYVAQELVPLVCARVFAVTGDVLLCVFTAGRRKTDSARFVRDQPRYTVFTDVAAYIGAAFWVAVIGGVLLWGK